MKSRILLIAMAILFISLNGCKKEETDPCETTICLNDGYCVNGECVCPEGYTGVDCSQQITPTSIRLNKIDVKSFPATNNGAGWDIGSGPDIYPVLVKGSNVIWESTTYFENANPSADYSFNVNPVVNLNPNDQYSILLYDEDGIWSDEYMGGVSFFPYSNKNNFPNVINLDAGGDVTFKLYVTYVW